MLTYFQYRYLNEEPASHLSGRSPAIRLECNVMSHNFQRTKVKARNTPIALARQNAAPLKFDSKPFLNSDNCRPEVVIDAISGVAVDYADMDVPVPAKWFCDSWSRFKHSAISYYPCIHATQWF